MEPGEIWGYRARHKDKLAPVRVVRQGTAKPARVLVQFEAPAMEGRQEWVPPVRLKVPWEQVEEFNERESRWEALRALAPIYDTVEAVAAHDVFEALIADEVATMGWRDHCLVIGDMTALSAASGIPERAFTGDPVGFVENGRLVVSWPVTVATAKALAERNPEPILAAVVKEERRYQREAIYGDSIRGRSGAFTVSPETIQELDAESERPRRELLRSWCGAAAVDRWDELAELRREIKRVGDVAERCIEVLRANGLKRDADQLAFELGQTVEMLRTDRD